MKKLLTKLSENKTTICGIAVAVALFLNQKGNISNDGLELVIGVCTVLGFAFAKDNSKHSTTEQVRKADKR